MNTILHIWKTVVSGIVYPTQPYRIGEVAREMLDLLVHRSMLGLCSFDLVKVSGFDLGFDKPVSREVIYARAKELGLVLCPQGFGRLVRLLYPEQPLYEGLFIAMNPVHDSNGYPQIFTLGRDDSCLWLSAVSGQEDCLWAPLYVWVFVKPRK